jgi:hypothetical protein
MLSRRDKQKRPAESATASTTQQVPKLERHDQGPGLRGWQGERHRAAIS